MGKFSINCARVGMIGTNCYLLYDEDLKEAIIVDPGDNAAFLAGSIDNLELKPVAILLTHGHFDHIGAVNELKDRYDIPLYVSKKDAEMIQNPNMNMGGISVKVTEKDVLLEGCEEFELGGINFKVIATPGHTPGGLCYYISSEDVLLSGDTMFRYSWGRTDFPGGSAVDLMNSIKEKLLPLPEETVVYPGHEGATTIKNERITHDFGGNN